MTERREFLRNAATLVLAARFGAARAVVKPAPKNLSVLIIGGGFVGSQVAGIARAHGHSVTPVLRSMRGRTMKLKVEHGDELNVSEGQQWDAVIDADAQIPADIALLPPAVVAGAHRYILLSSTAVYARLDKPGIDETAPLAQTDDPFAPRANDKNASALKALCEQAVEKALPGRACVIRAGLPVGPGDPTGRFTYWPARVARGGEVLAPGKPSDVVQFIDVRDLADFVVMCAEREALGTFNADGPPTAIGTLLDTCKKVSKSDARFVWADAAFLAEKKISAYRDMPVWVPAGGDYIGFGRISSAKAKAMGLHYRPLVETVTDTLAWFKADATATDTLFRAGLVPKREADTLKAWHAAHAAH